MDIDFGDAGTAKCVLVPPYNCKSNKKKYNSNYVSKIVELNTHSKIVKNEIKISKYLLKKYKKIILHKYFGLVVDSCIVKSKKKIGSCNVNKRKKYIIMYSKNAGCKPINKASKIFVKKRNNTKKIHVNNIKNNKVIYDNSYYARDNIIRKCGDLTASDGHVLKLCFSNKYRKLNIKRLIKILSLLHHFKLIHFDIKLDNIIANSRKELRLIDFGGSVLLSSFKKIKLNNNFNKLVDKFYAKLYSWTNDYISPELIIIIQFHNNKNTTKEDMIDILKNKLESSFNKSYFNSVSNNELINLVDYVYNNKIEFIRSLIDNDIVKTDIYGMGMTFYYIFDYLFKKKINLSLDKIENNKLLLLIYNMTRIDYRLRYNINQCINVDYFK